MYLHETWIDVVPLDTDKFYTNMEPGMVDVHVGEKCASVARASFVFWFDKTRWACRGTHTHMEMTS